MSYSPEDIPITFVHGDIVRHTGKISEADVITLIRSIYHLGRKIDTVFENMKDSVIVIVQVNFKRVNTSIEKNKICDEENLTKLFTDKGFLLKEIIPEKDAIYVFTRGVDK